VGRVEEGRARSQTVAPCSPGFTIFALHSPDHILLRVTAPLPGFTIFALHSPDHILLRVTVAPCTRTQHTLPAQMRWHLH